MRRSLERAIPVLVLFILPCLGFAQASLVREDAEVYYCINLRGGSRPEVRCDGPMLVHEGGFRIQSHLNSHQFGELEQAFALWNSGAEKYTDGSWKLDSIRSNYDFLFLEWKRWDADQANFTAWKKEKPGSVPEALLEAMYWQQYAKFTRNPNPPGGADPDTGTLSQQRLGMALQRLQDVQSNRKNFPLWYPLMISVLVDLGRPIKEIKAVYEEGITSFPSYLSIYCEMARALLPSQGGSEAGFDQFALEAAQQSKAIDGSGMYARLYAFRDREMEKDPTTFFPSRPVSWKRMKSSLDDLVVHHPKSTYLLNLYASFACRAGDSATYGKMRKAVGDDVVREAWVEGYKIDSCDVDNAIDPDAI